MEDDSRWWHHLWVGWIISLICSRKIERMAVFFSFSTVSNIFVEMKKKFVFFTFGSWTLDSSWKIYQNKNKNGMLFTLIEI
jgi:hypothetical protein